jgi:hypothetical protein
MKIDNERENKTAFDHIVPYHFNVHLIRALLRVDKETKDKMAELYYLVTPDSICFI